MPDRVEEARRQFREALVDEGVYDAATADALLAGLTTRVAPIVGNIADLQRMGAAQIEPPSEPEVGEVFVNPEAQASDGGGDGGDGDGGDGDGLESMTKAQLLDEANRRGVDVNQSMTKAEIIAELESA